MSETTNSGITISGTVAGQTTTNETPIAPFTNVTIADSDSLSQGELLTVTLSDMNAGSLSNLGSGSYSNGTFTDVGSLAAVNADLQGLIFTPAAGTPGTPVTTSFTISDSNGIDAPANDATTTVTDTDGPIISGTAANQTVTEQTTVMPFYNVVIADESGQLETVTVTLSDPTAGGLTNLGGGSYDTETGVYTGFGSTATVTTDLAGLVFMPAAGQTGTTTFSIGDTDTGDATATNNATSVVTTAGLTITGTLADQMVSDQATINPFANVVIGDTTGQNETVTVTLFDAANGTLGDPGGAGFTATGTPGVYTDSGSAATITTDLQALMFTPVTAAPGTSVTTTFTISDTNAAETTVSDTNTSVLTTSGPAISGTFPDQTTTDQGTIMPFSNVMITDDSGQMETVTVTLSDTANGTLSGSGGFVDSNGVYTDTNVASVVTADLDGLVFTPTMGMPGQSVATTFTISDTDTAAVNATDSMTSVITTSGPMISGGVGGQTTVNQTTIKPFAQVSITDDAGQIETVTITLSETANGTLSNLGGFVYDDTSGVYTDTGVASAVTADLDALVFTPAAGTPGTSVATGFTISDIDTASVTATNSDTSVLVTAGPTISGAVADQALTDQMTNTPFASVVIADITGQTETVTVTLADPTSGSLSGPGVNGFTATSTPGVYTDTGDAATVSADLEGLVFTPTEGVPGQSVTTVFTIGDTDGSAATATDNTTSVITSAGPTINGAVADQALSDQMTIAPFANVVIADDTGQTETVTVTLSNPANGSLSGSGFTASETPGVYTDTGAASTVTADLDGLQFTPTPGVPGQTVTTGFTLSDTDTAGVTVTNSTASVITSAGPSISHTIAGQPASSYAAIAPFANVVITDDTGQTETVTVTLSNPANGNLSGSGFTAGGTSGTYTATGYAADVTGYLQGLMFMPAAGTSGQSVSTVFTISDTDTGGVTVSDGTTSVVTSSGPIISGTAADQTATDQNPITPFSNVVIADDPELTETVTVLLSNAANGSLRGSGFTAGETSGTYTASGSATAVTGYLDTLVFTPAAGMPGQTVTTVFTIIDNNSSTGRAADNTTSVITLGGPAITGTVAGQTIGDQATIAPFAHVAVTDESSQSETVTVTLSAATNGALSNLSGGTYNRSTGVYTNTGSAAAVMIALDNLVFTPAVNSSTVTTDFSIVVTDTADISAHDSTTSVVASGVNLTTIEADGLTALLQAGNEFEMNPVAGGPGVTLMYQGTAVVSGEFGGWTPIAAEQISGGYQVAWKLASTGQYIVWNTDTTGNFTTHATAVLSAADPALETLETSFQQDLNGDGHIGVVTIPIEAHGLTALAQVGNQYQMTPVAGGTAVTLMYQGTAVVSGEFGGWTPIAAEQTSGGYQVAWKLAGTGQYIVWNTDTTGNFTTHATAIVAATDAALETLETSFQQDLNGDGQIGPPTIEADGVTKLVQLGNGFEMNPVAGGPGVTLMYQGTAVVSGEFGGWTPIAAEQISGGFQVAWKLASSGQYIVWDTNTTGNFTTHATSVVSGQDFGVEDLEPSFHQDLNGDGRVSAVLATSTTGGGTLDLSDSEQATTVNLGTNTASASPGLNASSLTFIGTPDAITLGSTAATIEYSLAATSGIETIAHFILGTDELNIDLMGAANSVLKAYNTTVGGVNAIAIASSADPLHGLVLLNSSGIGTAASLLASHVTFTVVGSHALVS